MQWCRNLITLIQALGSWQHPLLPVRGQLLPLPSPNPPLPFTCWSWASSKGSSCLQTIACCLSATSAPLPLGLDFTFHLCSFVLRICKGPIFHTIGRPEDFFFQDCISFQWEAGTGSSLALQEFSLACSSHWRTDTECLLCARSSARLFKWGRYTWWQNLRYCQQGSAAIEGSSGPFPKQARVTYSYDASSKSILLYQSTACSLTQLPESLSSGEPGGSILSTHAFYLT